MSEQLSEGKCFNCDKPIKVPLIDPYEGKEKPTGMNLQSMDEGFAYHYLGMVCFDCAWKKMEEGKLTIGYAGYPWSWEAVLN